MKTRLPLLVSMVGCITRLVPVARCGLALVLLSCAWHAHAYVPCSGAGTVGGAGKVIQQFTVGVDNGAICNFPSATGDPLRPTLTDEYWLEIQNNGGVDEQCSATLYILEGFGGTASLFGATPISPGTTVRVVDTAPLVNTSGIDWRRTVESVSCRPITGSTPPPPSPPPTSPPSPPSTGNVSLVGPYSVTVDIPSRVVSAALGVSYPSSLVNAQLRMELWATTTPYYGGSLHGWRLAVGESCWLQAAPQGMFLCTNAGNWPLDKVPPPGTYSLVFVATAVTPSCTSSDRRCIVAYASAIPGLLTVVEPFPPAQPPVQSPSSSSSGGGGALDVTGLAGFALCALVAMRYRRLRKTGNASMGS